METQRIKNEENEKKIENRKYENESEIMNFVKSGCNVGKMGETKWLKKEQNENVRKRINVSCIRINENINDLSKFRLNKIKRFTRSNC